MKFFLDSCNGGKRFFSLDRLIGEGGKGVERRSGWGEGIRNRSRCHFPVWVNPYLLRADRNDVVYDDLPSNHRVFPIKLGGESIPSLITLIT